MNFLVESYERESQPSKSKLTDAAKGFFYMINEFAKIHNLKTVTLFLVDNCLQNLNSDTCGFFQLYFCTNLFLPTNESQILNDKNLNIKAIEKLLNEFFSTNIDQNEKKVEKFAK